MTVLAVSIVVQVSCKHSAMSNCLAAQLLWGARSDAGADDCQNSEPAAGPDLTAHWQ